MEKSLRGLASVLLLNRIQVRHPREELHGTEHDTLGLGYIGKQVSQLIGHIARTFVFW